MRVRRLLLATSALVGCAADPEPAPCPSVAPVAPRTIDMPAIDVAFEAMLDKIAADGGLLNRTRGNPKGSLYDRGIAVPKLK